MKKIIFILFVLVAVVWLNGCKPKPVITPCDNSITNWYHAITKIQAKAYIDSLKPWRTSNHALNPNNLAIAELFIHARDMMRNMMLRDSCVGIRVYYGLKDGRIIPIICGVKADSTDIYWQRPIISLSKSSGSAPPPTTEDVLLDVSAPEPPVMLTNTLH